MYAASNIDINSILPQHLRVSSSAVFGHKDLYKDKLHKYLTEPKLIQEDPDEPSYCMYSNFEDESEID